MIMGREKLFKEFLEECKKNHQICGAGNPYAHILLVGQEHYAKKRIDNRQWNDYLEGNYAYCSVENNPWIKKDENDNRWRNYQNPSKTWYYYQQLINKALPKRLNRSERGVRDFEFDAFTTELNNEAKPSSTTDREGVKGNIESRLKIFERSKFIQSFSVIVLACGNYLTNSVELGVTQINDTFGVIFDDDLNNNGVPKGWHKSGKGKLWFTTHHSEDKQKLVIHTRQFSLRYTSSEDREWLINEMGTIIRDHLDQLKNLD